MSKTQAPAPAHVPASTRVTGRELNRFSIQGASIYDHLDKADVLIRVDGDWESEADRDEYVNALAERLQYPAVGHRAPLTEEQIRQLDFDSCTSMSFARNQLAFARAIERAHGIGAQPPVHHMGDANG